MSSRCNRRVLIALVGVAGAISLTPVSARAWTPIVSSGVFSSTATKINFDSSLIVGFITDPNLLLAQGIVFPVPIIGDYILNVTGVDGNVIDVTDGILKINFVNPVDAAGVDYSSSSQLTFSAYDSAMSLIGTANSPVGAGAGFFGVNRDGDEAAISTIVINDHAGRFQIDNLTFDTVAAVHAPAPGAAALAGLGLLLVGLGRRRLA